MSFCNNRTRVWKLQKEDMGKLSGNIHGDNGRMK